MGLQGSGEVTVLSQKALFFPVIKLRKPVSPKKLSHLSYLKKPIRLSEKSQEYYLNLWSLNGCLQTNKGTVYLQNCD